MENLANGLTQFEKCPTLDENLDNGRMEMIVEQWFILKGVPNRERKASCQFISTDKKKVDGNDANTQLYHENRVSRRCTHEYTL